MDSHFKHGPEGYFRNPGFGQNTVLDSRNVNGIQIWLLPRKRDLPKFGHGFGIGKENDIRDSEVRDARFLSRKKRREHGIQSLETGNTCHLAWGSIPVCLSPSWEPECRLTSFCFRKAINGFTRWTSRNYDFKNILSGSKLSFLWAPTQQ